MMQLINIVSASHTAVAGVIDLVLEADIGNGAETLPFTYSPADPYGLAPMVGAWLEAHPAVPIADYVAPEPVPLTRIPKDLIWRRATDAEADMMEQALASKTARLRRIYEGATYISTTDELYGILQGAMVQLFGEGRSAELLDPTEA